MTKSGVKYYARIFVARGGNDGLLRLPLNKRLQVNIGDGYYRAPDPSVETNSTSPSASCVSTARALPCMCVSFVDRCRGLHFGGEDRGFG